MSMRQAINSKCKDCIYDEHDIGTWRQQVQRCSEVDCGLYPYRPITKPRKLDKTVNSTVTNVGRGENGRFTRTDNG